MARREAQKLPWLELGRGIAALLVVLFHASLVGAPASFLNYSIPAGMFAVAFFFVLSGFIILYVHGDDVGNVNRARIYVWRRLIRIFPTYWLVLLIDFSLHLLSHDKGAGMLSAKSAASNFFLEPGITPYISVAWTLRHELLFYGLFIILIVNKKIGLAAFGLWLCAIAYTFITAESFREWPPLNTVTSPLNFCFFIGLAFAAILRRIDHLSFPSWTRFRQIPLWFGKISYPLYLIHPTVYFALGGAFKRLSMEDLPWSIKLVIVIALSLAISSIISSFYEVPVLRFLRRLAKTGDHPRQRVPA